MTEKLKSKLVNALEKAGMNEGLASAFEGADEETVEAFIGKLKPQKQPTITPEEFVGSKAFEDYLDKHGFDDLLAKSKKAQSAFDKKTSKALNTFKKNLLGGDASDDDDKKGGGVDLNSDSNDPVIAMLAELKAQLAELKKEKETESKLGSAKQALEKSKLPKAVQEKWITRIDVNAETSIEDQVKSLEEEYESLVPEGSQGGADYQFQQSRKGNAKISQSEEKALGEFASKYSPN